MMLTGHVKAKLLFAVWYGSSKRKRNGMSKYTRPLDIQQSIFKQENCPERVGKSMVSGGDPCEGWWDGEDSTEAQGEVESRPTKNQ